MSVRCDNNPTRVWRGGGDGLTNRTAVLDCGHTDDDPTSFHTTGSGLTVCAGCCPICHQGDET